MSSLTRSPTAPRSVEDFHDRLQAVSGELPKRLRQCAEYLAANTDRIAVSTVAAIAVGALTFAAVARLTGSDTADD